MLQRVCCANRCQDRSCVPCILREVIFYREFSIYLRAVIYNGPIIGHLSFKESKEIDSWEIFGGVWQVNTLVHENLGTRFQT